MTLSQITTVDTDGTRRVTDIPGGLQPGGPIPRDMMGVDLTIPAGYALSVPCEFTIGYGLALTIESDAIWDIT